MHPNDPLYAEQWHLTRLGNIEKIWDEYSGAGIQIGIYDTGVRRRIRTLLPAMTRACTSPSQGCCRDGQPDPVLQPDSRPRAHGTAVAGIIGAQANNGEGGVGVAWGAALTSVNIADSLFVNAGNGDRFIEAIEQMVSFDVTNNSWNRFAPFFLPTDNISDPASYVLREVNAFAFVSETGRNGLGTVIVQGVGNNNLEVQGNGLNSTRFTISVAGAGPTGFMTDYSNYGASILVTAPTGPSLTVFTRRRRHCHDRSYRH